MTECHGEFPTFIGGHSVFFYPKKEVGAINKSIKTKMLTGVVTVMFTLGIFLIYVGYSEISDAIEKQYADTAFRTARTALTFIDGDRLGSYDDTVNDAETVALADVWQVLADTQDSTFVYAIQPDVSKDYSEIRFVLSIMNRDAGYDHFNSGYVRATSNEEYRQAYIDLYERSKNQATIVRDKGVSSTGDHITVMLPIENSSGEITGILCVQRQMDDLKTTRLFYLKNMAVVTLAILILMLFIQGNHLKLNLLHPLKVLSDGVREIISGNLDKKIDIKTGDELEHLSIAFNAMTSELQTYMKNLTQITAEKERIATELNVAKEIQRGMLPQDFDFGRSDFEIFATMNAAKAVGGDFYDFYLLDENHLAITVADVSGKGIPASLFMVISKTVLKNFATFSTSPDDYAAVLSCANNQLCQGNEEMMFVTVFFGVLEIDSGRFVYVNGGHNPPVIYHRAENKCEFLAVKKNFVLGGMEDVPYKQQEIRLEHGDLLFAYTDGVNEAMNENHEEYTSERLLNFMNGTDCGADLQTLLAAIRADVAEHVGNAEQSDDITMMALRLN